MNNRGGGPFGAGRLQTQAEILELEQSLLKMVDVIRHDTETNFNTAPVAATTSATQKNNDRFAEPKKPLPQLSKPVASAPVAAPRQAAAAPALVKQVVAQPKPVMQSPPVTPSLSTAVAPIEEGPIPIALGLDRFLAAPESASVMEMEGLRDGLIECLSLLQRNIRERVFAGESVQTPPNAAPVSGK